MDWIPLNDVKQLPEIVAESNKGPVLIYKHSTRCNISRTAFDRLQRKWKASSTGNVKRYFLDLIAHRHVSNQVAEQFGVEHQSPQILIISEGRSILDLSHFEIDFDNISAVLTAN